MEVKVEDKKRGIPAAAGSKRREFRKLRRPTQKDTTTSKDVTKSSKLCKFFGTEKGCRNGENCRFQHGEPISAADGDVSDASRNLANVELVDKAQKSPEEPKVEVFYPPAQTSGATAAPNGSRAVRPEIVRLKKDDLYSGAQEKEFKAEVLYFQRRYRHAKFDECASESGGSSNQKLITFRYDVTDPEWVFDIRSITFSIRLLAGHPIEQPLVFLPYDANPRLMDVLLMHLASKTNDAIREKYEVFAAKDAYENIGKWLIKWLDKNIFNVFVDGLRKVKLVEQAKAAGISLVAPKAPTKKSANAPEDVDAEKCKEQSESGRSESDDEAEDGNDGEEEETSTAGKEDRPAEESAQAFPIDVVLVWNNVRVRGELVHEASNVLCRMAASGCRPVDCVLLDSTFKIVCLACDREDDLQKVNYGDVHKSWCRGCHVQLELAVSAIRFRGEATAVEDRDVAGAIPKPKKKPEKTMTVEEGRPLPNKGACKHYQKSYRWFRFPCCGKLYPCDTCHEEATNGEHEMKLANRIVCGLCSKEQPFAKDKPCAGCNESTTRKKTQFWEGGKGCRDQTKMSRNDGHKFVNSKKKTVAKGVEVVTKNKK